MAMTDNILPFLTRFHTRATWISALLLVVFLWTFAHLNFNYIPPQDRKSAHVPYSHTNKHPEDEPIYFHHDHVQTSSHTPAYTELAKAPLKIYIPPESSSNQDLLTDIWDTPIHRGADADRNEPEDNEAYYKALNCPVCVNPDADKAGKAQCTTDADLLKSTICPPQPFDISKCPSLQQLQNPEYQKNGVGVPAASSSVYDKKPLISYIYTESNVSRTNLAFFTNHALHDAADFVFVLYGNTTVDEDILPKGRTNINIFKRSFSNLTCNPLTAHAEILGDGKDGRTSLMNTYEKFILMDSSVRGPFIPRWSRACWSTSFLSLLQEKTKLVGTSLACMKGQRPHLQSHILATDRRGLATLLKDKRLHTTHCPRDPKEHNIVHKVADRDITFVIREQGWEAVVLEMVFADASAYRYLKCEMDQDRFVGEGVMGETKVVGGRGNETLSIDPWEVLFVGPGVGEEEQRRIKEVSRRVGGAGYSSYEACK